MSTEKLLMLLPEQERLERAADITGRLAHDFGNILTGILGFAELALPQLQQDTLAHRYLGEVLASARQGADWVHKLHLFSRRSQLPFARPNHESPPATDLRLLLAEEESRPEWRQGMSLQMELPPEMPLVALEKEALRQVLRPLLDNAREAMQSAPALNPAEAHQVSLRARLIDLPEADCQEFLGNLHPGPHVELTITDTGVGLSANVQARLFQDMFFSTKGRRRGLGLLVVYGILHTFQGGYRLEPGVERGVAAKVLLPLNLNNNKDTSHVSPGKKSGSRRHRPNQG